MIRIDEEFKNLIPALSADERNGLEESLLKEGCRDALAISLIAQDIKRF